MVNLIYFGNKIEVQDSVQNLIHGNTSPVNVLSSLEEYENLEEPIFILLDIENVINVDEKLVKNIDKIPNPIIGIIAGKEDTFEKVKLFKKCEKINHLFFCNPNRVEDDLRRIISVYGSSESPSIEKMVDLKKLNLYELKSSQDRHECFDLVEKYTSELKCFSSFKNIAWMISSELLTNAFYNAPRCEKTGEAKFPDRKSIVNLDSSQVVKFWYGVDGEYLWLIVEDPFGTLEKQTLIQSLYRAAKDKTPNWRVDNGGAGLGLYLMLVNCTEIHFSLSNKTLVACKLKITKRNKAFSEEQASMHIFENLNKNKEHRGE
ncbi:MAG: hypothetical protein KDD50_05910 [Bdellovibrionales bacterium]|nr:hypothetical protein [Bdellovibrionales bacterium]